MAKILEFKRMHIQVENLKEIDIETDDISAYVHSIMNDCSLTVANRHWILENALMNINEKLDEYKIELEKAELRLNTLVTSAELEISAAYTEFNAHIAGMTRAVKSLTGPSSRPNLSGPSNGLANLEPDQHTTS